MIAPATSYLLLTSKLDRTRLLPGGADWEGGVEVVRAGRTEVLRLRGGGELGEGGEGGEGGDVAQLGGWEAGW